MISSKDPREEALNDVSRRIMVASNYDPHYSGLEDKVQMETKLWLARFDALIRFSRQENLQSLTREVSEDGDYRITEASPQPIPMILFCPKCCLQHIDQPDKASGWTNPPHRSHLCVGCNFRWRPADVATIGVKDIQTRGKDDDQPIIRNYALRFRVWRRRTGAGTVTELARGEWRGQRIVAYLDDYYEPRFIDENEFLQDFEKIGHYRTLVASSFGGSPEQ